MKEAMKAKEGLIRKKSGGGVRRTKKKSVKGRCRAMDNKLKAVYLKGYQAAFKSIIENLKKQEGKIEAEIERCLTREEE